MKLLIIEDEREMAQTMMQYLRQESYVCEIAYTAQQAEEKIHLHSYDCVLLDITLPDGNGFSILEQLKKPRN